MILEAGFISPVFRAAGILAGARPRESAVARQPLSAAMGMVPHLFRIGRRRRWPAAIPPGAISRPWTTTTRTARCPPGSAGTCSTFRTGFTPRPCSTRSRSSSSSSWMLFLPRRFRIALFCIVTPFETRHHSHRQLRVPELPRPLPRLSAARRPRHRMDRPAAHSSADRPQTRASLGRGIATAEMLARAVARACFAPVRMTIAGICLGLILLLHHGTARLEVFPNVPLPEKPVEMLEPFRIAERYGLFEVMTHARYEIEFQGSHRRNRRGRRIPSATSRRTSTKPPGIYAPYQPRFEWNLWFASLGAWRQYRFVLWTEERLLLNEPDVLAALRAQSVRRRSAEAGPRGHLPILVHRHEDEARDREPGGGASCSAITRRRSSASRTGKSSSSISTPSKRRRSRGQPRRGVVRLAARLLFCHAARNSVSLFGNQLAHP